MSKASILIVEDKFIVAQDIAISLRKLGYTVVGIAASAAEALEKARTEHPHLVLMDIHIKGGVDGVDAAAMIKEELSIPIVFLTAHSDKATLDRAAETDPCGYLIKPYDERQLYSTIELALNRSRMMRSNFLKENPDVFTRDDESQKGQVASGMNQVIEDIRSRSEFSSIIGVCPKLLQLLHNIELVARTDVTVHICGENGTGKELVADALHQLSSRRQNPFIKINCSAIPSALLESALFGHSKGAFTGASKDQEGFIERAEGGTLFLDEIGDVSAEIQVKLLRLLQNREYSRVGETVVRRADIRIVTATNRDLKDLVHQGKVREDFFYRIHVFPLEVPPLRERGDDIFLLAEHFRALFNKLYSKSIVGFSDQARILLLNYDWPGNVRELENAMRRAFILAQEGLIEHTHLPSDVVAAGSTSDSSSGSATTEDGSEHAAEERDAIVAALETAAGNKTKAAEILGYSRVTLWKKLNRYGIAR